MRNGFGCNWRPFVVFGLLVAGCTRSPAGIAVPEWDPAAAADRALAEYDSNGDKKLSRDELKKCPGLLSALKQLDRDGDGSLSGDELTTKLREIRQQDAALVEITCTVMHNAAPVQGATIVFVPESFMGDAVKPATGVTGPDGVAFPSIADEELPEKYRGKVHGVPCGVFHVVVTEPNGAVSKTHSTQTTIGRVVSRRDHETLTINL